MLIFFCAFLFICVTASVIVGSRRTRRANREHWDRFQINAGWIPDPDAPPPPPSVAESQAAAIAQREQARTPATRLAPIAPATSPEAGADLPPLNYPVRLADGRTGHVTSHARVPRATRVWVELDGGGTGFIDIPDEYVDPEPFELPTLDLTQTPPWLTAQPLPSTNQPQPRPVPALAPVSIPSPSPAADRVRLGRFDFGADGDRA